MDGRAGARCVPRRSPARGPGAEADPIEILAFEGTTSATIAASVAAVEPLARRLRVMGSLALSFAISLPAGSTPSAR